MTPPGEGARAGGRQGWLRGRFGSRGAAGDGADGQAGARTAARERTPPVPPSVPPPAAAPAPAPVPAPPAVPSGWSARDVERLAEALGGFADLHQPQFFHEVLVSVGRRLDPDRGPFPVPARDHPRDRVAALANAVDRHKDPDAALRALTDTLRFLRGQEAAMVRLDDLAEDLSPATRLPGPRLRAVTADLDAMKAGVPVALAHAALRRALRPGEPSGLRGDETVAELVRRLSDAREAPGGARTEPGGGAPDEAGPLVLRFLAELAAALPGTPGGPGEVMRGHVGLAAAELELDADTRVALAERARPRAQGREHGREQGREHGKGHGREQGKGHGGERDRDAVPHAPSRVLQIRLRETAPGRQEYRLDAALFDRAGDRLGRPLRREAERSFSLGQLQELGRTCLVDWSDLAARLDDADRVQLEFLLPWSLLGHPVEHWLTDGDAYLAGHKYPLVVRSLDRMERPSWRRDWTRRWKALQNGPGAGPLAGWPARGLGWLALDPAASFAALTEHRTAASDIVHVRGRDGEVRAWLDKHPESTGLGLAFSYDPRTPRRALGLREAVCEGVPFVVWRRDDGDPGELAARLGEMDGAAVGELPDRLRLWRRAAPRDDPADMHNHLTLLWDDPECVHRETPLAAPAPAAGPPAALS